MIVITDGISNGRDVGHVHTSKHLCSPETEQKRYGEWPKAITCWVLPKANRGIQGLVLYGALGAKHLHVRQKIHLKSRAGIKSRELPRATGLYKPTYLGRVEKADTVS